MDSLFPDVLDSKSCTNCGQPKPLKLFPKINEWCRQCLKEARESAPPGKCFCADCKAYLSLSEFNSRIVYTGQANGEVRYASPCKKCHAKKAFELHRQKYDATVSRDKNLQKNYGITLAEYEALLLAQGGVCAICKLPEKTNHPRWKTLSPLSVDHDHITGKVRGLLCAPCNYALGVLCEDIARLQAMIDYIRKYKID